MAMNSMQANMNPSPANTSQSKDEHGASADSPEVAEARGKVLAAEKWTGIANKVTIILLIVYVLATASVAGSTPLTLWANGRLRSAEGALNDLLLADANRRAGVANEAAGLANERAGKLESDNLTLRGQVATLESAASDAKTQLAEQQGRTAILEKAANDARRQLAAQEGQTAELRRRAAEAETELAQVKEYASLRLKSGEQLKVISERLKDLPRGKLKVFWAANDFDAYTIADNTVEVFRMLGWQVDGPERTLEALFPIAIASENPNDGPTTSAIIEAFRAAGFDARGSSTFKLPPDRIVIVVGSQQRKLFPENPRPKK